MGAVYSQCADRGIIPPRGIRVAGTSCCVLSAGICNPGFARPFYCGRTGSADRSGGAADYECSACVSCKAVSAGWRDKSFCCGRETGQRRGNIDFVFLEKEKRRPAGAEDGASSESLFMRDMFLHADVRQLLLCEPVLRDFQSTGMRAGRAADI